MRWKATDQSIGWFRDIATGGTLTIAPPYQRRPVWRLKERCYLIESILLGFPIPEIYVHRTSTPKGKTLYAVVDGQQRIRTLLKFMGLDQEDPEDNNFALSTLEETSPWYGYTFERLTDEQKVVFSDYSLAVRFIDTKDDGEVREMFVRLNRYLASLKGQELRNAWFKGPFIELSMRLADADDYLVREGVVTTATVRRMGDIELVGELLAACMFGPQDGSRGKIDALYRDMEQYETEIPAQAQIVDRYRTTLGIIQQIFPDLRNTRRWSNRHDFYSLFTAITHYLREGKAFNGNTPEAAVALESFAESVNKYIEDDSAKVTRSARDYARAIQKGPSAKARRAIRHQELLKVLEPFFE